jgi:hypothetical protein
MTGHQFRIKRVYKPPDGEDGWWTASGRADCRGSGRGSIGPGRWLIIHEHVSVPVDLDTGKPDLSSKP